MTIASSNPTVSPAPSTLFFPQGQTSMSMNVVTTGVAVDTPVTITATLGISVSASVTVLPPFAQQIQMATGQYGGIPVYIAVILTVDNLTEKEKRQKAEINLRLPGKTVNVASLSHDLYAAIDALTDKLDRCVKKHKEKRSDHHAAEAQKSARAMI